MINLKIIDELKRLSSLLNKYGHRWSENPSSRMITWVERYNDIKELYPEEWKEFCKSKGYSEEHDAHDCMA